jgi:hypothetical protein
MSLGRFLAAGRSLMGMPSDDSRYRMTSKSRLPKFGSDKNPFAPAPKAEPVKTEVSRVAVAAPAPVRLATEQVSLFESKAAEQKPAEIVSEVKAAPIEAPKIEVKAVLAVVNVPAAPKGTVMDLRNIVKNFNAVEYVTSWTSRWKKAPRPVRTHVQTELRLDKVRPVRNDLSDTDLEVVAPKRVELAKGPQPYLKPLTKPEPTTWNRLTTRIFGHSEVR